MHATHTHTQIPKVAFLPNVNSMILIRLSPFCHRLSPTLPFHMAVISLANIIKFKHTLIAGSMRFVRAVAEGGKRATAFEIKTPCSTCRKFNQAGRTLDARSRMNGEENERQKTKGWRTGWSRVRPADRQNKSRNSKVNCFVPRDDAAREKKGETERERARNLLTISIRA